MHKSLRPSFSSAVACGILSGGSKSLSRGQLSFLAAQRRTESHRAPLAICPSPPKLLARPQSSAPSTILPLSCRPSLRLALALLFSSPPRSCLPSLSPSRFPLHFPVYTLPLLPSERGSALIIPTLSQSRTFQLARTRRSAQTRISNRAFSPPRVVQGFFGPRTPVDNLWATPIAISYFTTRTRVYSPTRVSAFPCFRSMHAVELAFLTRVLTRLCD
eukprot:6184683-Pleurochrysis_carterae.AAC.2